ncbi:unnamed protein product, partial [Effrenium voratum]
DTTKKSLMAAQRILSNIELACQPSRDDADVSAARVEMHYETYSPAMQRRLAILLVRHIRLLVASLGLPLQVPEMKAGDVRPLAERALAEAHGTNQAAGVRWVLDLGYPVPKYMTLRECEEVIATLLPDAEREVWSMQPSKL